MFLLEVQCVLSINLFNEKVFIFLWFWICLVAFMNIFDLFGWIHSLLMRSHDSYNYIKQRLYAANNPNGDTKFILTDSEERKIFKKFVKDYLKEDGVLALRIISRNSQDLIVSEVIAKLFESFKENQKLMKEQKRARKLKKHRHHQVENEA